MNDNIISKFANFNLNQYQAKAYITLLRIGTSNAYKVSKESGIPRARIYDILRSLAYRGIVMIEETVDGSKFYSPIPADIFFSVSKPTGKTILPKLKVKLRKSNRKNLRIKYMFHP